MGRKHYAQWTRFTYWLWYQQWRLIKWYKNAWFKNVSVYLDPAGKTKIMTAGIKGGVMGWWAESALRLRRTPALWKWTFTPSNNIQLKGSRAHLSFFLCRKSYVFSGRHRTITVNLNIWETVSEMSQVSCINEIQVEVLDFKVPSSMQPQLFCSTKLIK